MAHPTPPHHIYPCLLLFLLLLATHEEVVAKRVQVFGFAVLDTPTYKGYDWSVLTTSAWRTDPELIDIANQHGAKVELNAGDVTEIMGDADKRKAWVQDRLVDMVKTGATGINFDLELPLKPGSQAAADYTALVTLMSREAHAAIPGAQVSVDIPWSPYDIDGRSYDWHGLAAAADLLFIMMYDTQSQILGRCIASANSPIDTVRKGVQHWLDFGLPADKLVLGLPWYGYDYPCEPSAASGQAAAADVDVCLLKSVPFRGVSCSDAAGSQKCYWQIMEILAQGRNTTAVRWDEMQHSPFFNYKGDDGLIYQIWYDTPESLAAKYAVARDMGLAGIGVWNLDCLDYFSSDPRVVQQTKAMWAAAKQAVEGWNNQQQQQQQPHHPEQPGGSQGQTPAATPAAQRPAT